MVQRNQTHAIFLLICGLLVVLSLSLMGVPDVQAQTPSSCPEGQIWSLNRCVSEEERTCPTGFTYVADNGCVMIPEQVQACPNGYVMEGGRCQLAGQACPAGEIWRDGSCQAREEQSCPAGQERVNGSCFQITETICPVGYTWSDSKTRCEDNNNTDDDDDDNGNGNNNGNNNGNGNIIVPSILILSDTTLTLDEGCNETYTITLRSQPSGDVTVTIGDPSNTDVTADPATLTFTPDNWDEPQTVTVTCHEDDDAVDDEATVTHTVDGPGLDSVVDEDLDIEVIDNDEAGVTISASYLTVAEVCNETYTIQLNTEPTGDVTVTIGDPSNIAVTADPATLTFTPDNWDEPQTVTVTCTEDDNAVDEVSIVTHTVSGSDYDDATAPYVTFKVIDDDTVGVTISDSTLYAYEGSTETYTIKLDTEPTGNVKVTINDPSNTDVTADPATLTFTPDNWDEPQTVTVTAKEDDDGVNDRDIVTHTVSGGDYGSVTVANVNVEVVDNDTRGVTISEDSLTIDEGSTGTYTVKLDTEPTGDVTVTINDPTNTDVTTDPATLTFTTLNWQTPQTVMVTAKEDNDGAEDRATVTHTVAGGDYGLVTVANVNVTVTDNNTPGVTISKESLTVDEGSTGTYTVKLDTEPTGDVTVTINDPTNTDVTADPATLTFTTLNWQTPQTATVTATEDDDGAEDRATVTHTVSGGDYGLVSAASVVVTVTDNDTPGVTISKDSLTVDEGSTGTYTVKLDTEPTGDVTVTINDPTNTDVTADPATLTFTTLNWQDTQTVTVTATEDDDGAEDRATVTHTVSGGDYGSVTAANVDITVTDNDTRGVTISKDSLTVDEGSTGTYTVKLDTQPTGDVTVTINDPTNTDVTADPATLTFTTLNWQDTQTVTVTATEEDDDSANDAATVTHSVSGGDYGSVTAANVDITVTDNDATENQLNSGGLSELDSTSTTTVNVTTNLIRPYTTFTVGENVWHLLVGATSIKVEAFWYEDGGTESGDTRTLYTDSVGFDTVCPTATPDATVTSYAFDQDVVMPAAEPENAEPGVWKLRVKVEWDAVAAGTCNAANPIVPANNVPASNLEVTS